MKNRITAGPRRRNDRLAARCFVRATLILACLFLPGCSTPKALRSPDNADYVQLTRFWQPHLMYILAAPHPRLYVEVDAVEGCAPSEATLNKLREFLATCCNKPGGIEVARSDVIPAGSARGMSSPALARKFLTGPPESAGDSRPAFLYVLYYDGALCDQPAAEPGGQPGANAASRPRARNQNPHTVLLPCPVIYMNARFRFKSIHDELLLHEAGHALGLAGRPAGTAGYHCEDSSCRMNRAFYVHISRLLTFRDPFTQRQLCAGCLAELDEKSKQPPPSNLRFVGPVLVRSEAGYHVLNLPSRSKLVVGELAEQDCRGFAAAVRAENFFSGGGEYVRGDSLIKEEVLREPARLPEILALAAKDPYEPVRMVAPRAAACFYSDHRQYSNAVAICRKSLLSNPKDDWSCNLLAWILATCPDASVRDGQAAVAAATKACELTGWQNLDWIDTLAAAHAEAGDFKRAAEFEEQALRTGSPTEPQRKEMQERIARYRQGRPFRDQL